METTRTEEPIPHLYVDTVERVRRPDREDDFAVHHTRYTLDDGSEYDVQEFMPREPRFNVRATYTTPWCTDLEGFNKRVGSGLVREGMNVVAVSPERLHPLELPGRLGHLALLHDAQAHHAILNHLDVVEGWPHEAISVGYSRGAMVGFGLNARSMEHGRDIRYSDYIDPCLEHQVRIRDVNWTKVPGYVVTEFAALGEGLSHYSVSELLAMGSGALRPSVCFWLQQVALTRTLFSGEAGTFVDGWHPDSVAHINLYTRSRFNHTDDWIRRFAPLQNVIINAEPGVHLSGVNPTVLKHAISRVVLAQHLIEDGATPTELSAQILQWRPPRPTPATPRAPLFRRSRVA